VWNTETGSWDRGFYQGTNSNFSSWGKNLWPYADASRYYEGMVGSANSVVQNFLRTIASGQTNYFYYDSRAAASPEYLKGHTTMLEYDGTVRVKGVAYAIAGQLVDHSKGMGNVSPDPNTVMLMFDKPNSPIVALFSADKKPRQLTLSLASYQFQALDMMGNPIALNGTVIPYGRLPVYIRGVGISGSTLIGAMKGSLPSARADNTPPGVSISDAPTGTVRNNGFRVRWIAADDLSLPNLGEINPESNKASDAPNPDAIVYSYRLEGFVDWSPYTARTFVDFAQVPNGTYNFQVRAMDEAGNTSNIVSRAIVVNAQ
jgi:hypothetical protein